MDMRQLTPDLAVSAQILPEDLADLVAQGYRVLINNRPDEEVGPEIDSDAMRAAAEAAGMAYCFNPFTPGQITPDMIALQADALAQEGRKFAYCRSGNRSTVLWALTQAGQQPADDLIEAAARVGYDISGLRSLIESLAR